MRRSTEDLKHAWTFQRSCWQHPFEHYSYVKYSICRRQTLFESQLYLRLALHMPVLLSHGSMPPRHGGGKGRDRKDQEAVSPAAWLDEVETPLNSDLVEECRELLAQMPLDGQRFNLSVPGVSLYPSELNAFLGDTWLDDSAIYARCRYILHHAANPSLAFADTFHLIMLRRERERTPHYAARTELDESIVPGAARPATQVFLPLHVYGAHWTLFHLDLEAGTYSYADCLWGDEDPPREDLELIVWWLSGLGIETNLLQRVPFAIALPKQRDSSSCGVIVLNLMAALLLHYDLWSQDRAALERLRWFVRLARRVSEDDSDMENPTVSASALDHV